MGDTIYPWRLEYLIDPTVCEEKGIGLMWRDSRVNKTAGFETLRLLIVMSISERNEIPWLGTMRWRAVNQETGQMVML